MKPRRSVHAQQRLFPRGRRRWGPLLAILLSCLLHGAFGFLVLRQLAAKNTQPAAIDLPPMQVRIVQPAQSRPLRVLSSRMPRSARREQKSVLENQILPEQPGEARLSDPLAGASVHLPPIEDRWRISSEALRADSVATAVRRAQLSRFCLGGDPPPQGEEERNFCEKLWSKGRLNGADAR